MTRDSHDVNPDTLKCQKCGLFAFECAIAPKCDPGRYEGRLTEAEKTAALESGL